MKKGRWWPIGITVFLGVFVVSNIWVAVIASDPNALTVEPDYYAKAVNYDSTMRQMATNGQLGWRLVPTLTAVTRDSGAVLNVDLRDASGAPLSGATVSVVAIHNLIANQPVAATLGERSDGAYSVRLPLHRTGQWELTFDVRRGKDRFTADLRLDAAGQRHS
ncbi:MAG: FixH family protein [Gemmatimonadaceae bacterium]